MRKAAFSLLETALALSLMTLVFVYFVGVMQTSLGLRGRLLVETQAYQVAQNKLAQARAWAQQKTGSQYNYANLASFQPTRQTDPTLPFLQTEVTVGDYTLASPNTQFENAHAPADRRQLRQSAKRVTIRVLRDGQELVSLPGLVREPFRGWSATRPIAIQPNTARIPRNGSLSFTFTAYDESDQPIPDLCAKWNVMPVTGVAMVDVQSRDGSSANVTNHARRRNGTYFLTGGTCVVAVRIVYHGQERIGRTSPILLEGP